MVPKSPVEQSSSSEKVLKLKKLIMPFELHLDELVPRGRWIKRKDSFGGEEEHLYYLGITTLEEPFLAVYIDEDEEGEFRGIRTEPVRAFVIRLKFRKKNSNLEFLPVVMDGLHLKMEEETRFGYFLGVVPQKDFAGTQDFLIEEGRKKHEHIKKYRKSQMEIFRIVVEEPEEEPPLEELTQRASFRRGRIVEILARMEKQYENGAVPQEDLVAQVAKELKMEGKEDIIRKDIRAVYESGKIYSPKPGHYKTTPSRYL